MGQALPDRLEEIGLRLGNAQDPAIAGKEGHLVEPATGPGLGEQQVESHVGGKAGLLVGMGHVRNRQGMELQQIPQPLELGPIGRGQLDPDRPRALDHPGAIADRGILQQLAAPGTEAQEPHPPGPRSVEGEGARVGTCGWALARLVGAFLHRGKLRRGLQRGKSPPDCARARGGGRVHPDVRRADLFDFRRVFFLLIFTVCVPSLALSTFGVLAIKHERAVVEKRLEDLYGQKLDALAETLVQEMQVRPAKGGAEAVDLAARVPALAKQMFPDERARFELIHEVGADEDPIKSLLRSITRDDGKPAIVQRPLTGALAGNSLVVRLPGDDSPASIALVNRVVYVILLALFYGAIGVGVGLTSRAVYKEAKLSRLKSDFVSHVSHELRTPLTSIRLFVETLRLGRVRSDTERQECMELLDKEAERLAGLVDRLLDWARIESGRKVYRKVAQDPRAVAQEALAVFERQHLAEPGLVQVEMEEVLPQVEVDRDAVAVVLFNLLVNAWKYTGKEKQISLRVYGNGKRVAFEVEDNGPGIAKSERKRIFDQFYRVDDLLTRKTEGTGLGLAISRRIVEDHGGRIELDGELGRGSRFVVMLPAIPGSVA